MASIDENVEVGLELTTSTLRLTGRAIIAIMDLFLEKDDRKDYYQDLNNKQGKQKLKDLFTKYENTGVQSLGKNLSDEEKKFFEKELKSMGVDFSIRKVGKDNYSLFFAGKDIEAIEKGMENAIQKYAQREKTIENLKDKLNFKKVNKDEVVSKKEKKQDQKEKPKFTVNELQERHIKKQKENSKEKVRNKTQNRSL